MKPEKVVTPANKDPELQFFYLMMPCQSENSKLDEIEEDEGSLLLLQCFVSEVLIICTRLVTFSEQIFKFLLELVNQRAWNSSE